MKKMNLSVVLSLAACALWFASANPTNAGESYSRSRREDGRLVMKHSPTLGINIPIAVWIDGVQAGAFARGHIYSRYLTPGPHDVYASRPGRLYDSWYGTLDMRPGETYSFLVKCTVNHIILQPVGRID